MTERKLTGLRILVVEDEMMLLMMIEDLLEDVGCEAVAAAASISKALELLDRQAFDVAILDLNLNGHMSYPVADALARRGIPFLFATGYGIHGLAEAYRSRPVLVKPYPFNLLVSTLLRLVGPGWLRPEAA